MLPVVRELASAGVVVSIDTMRAEVARQALALGARMVNDVSGGKADPAMFGLVADAGVPMVIMHWRGLDHMQEMTSYGDIVEDVITELRPQIERAESAGIPAERIVIDPGLGFAKTAEHNWTLLTRLEHIVGQGYPVLVAASRKAFLGRTRRPDDRRGSTT